MNQQYIKLEDSLRDGYSVAVEALVNTVRINVCNDARIAVNTHISYDDARKLVEMLIKHTHPGQKLSLPMPVTAPQLILAWQHPVNGRRFIPVSCELVATQSAVELRRNQPDFPIWLAQIIKQHVQPTPAYEWKDL